jgi:hypothetical protein
MATITNVTLNLQRSDSRVSTSPRTATVTFTTSFSALEMEGEALFIADIKLQANDGASFGNPTLNMGTLSVQATDSLVERTRTVVFTRAALDEDPDTIRLIDQFGHPHIIHLEDYGGDITDEWRARVVLTPVIQTVTANSRRVTGSWGVDGNN